MSTKSRIRDAERALEREPGNLVLRLKLAAALREAGRLPDAVDLYRSVAVAYQSEGRLVQALAVCRSVLEIAPDDFPTRILLGELEEARTGAATEEPTRLASETAPPPSLTHTARLPIVDVAPDEYDYDEPDDPNDPNDDDDDEKKTNP